MERAEKREKSLGEENDLLHFIMRGDEVRFMAGCKGSG